MPYLVETLVAVLVGVSFASLLLAALEIATEMRRRRALRTMRFKPTAGPRPN